MTLQIAVTKEGQIAVSGLGLGWVPAVVPAPVIQSGNA